MEQNVTFHVVKETTRPRAGNTVNCDKRFGLVAHVGKYLRLYPPVPAPAASLEEAQTTAGRWGPLFPHSKPPPYCHNHPPTPTSASGHHFQPKVRTLFSKSEAFPAAESNAPWLHLTNKKIVLNLVESPETLNHFSLHNFPWVFFPGINYSYHVTFRLCETSPPRSFLPCQLPSNYVSLLQDTDRIERRAADTVRGYYCFVLL